MSYAAPEIKSPSMEEPREPDEVYLETPLTEEERKRCNRTLVWAFGIWSCSSIAAIAALFIDMGSWNWLCWVLWLVVHPLITITFFLLVFMHQLFANGDWEAAEPSGVPSADGGT